MRARVRAGLFLLIGTLFIVSVPWYRDTGAPVEIVWGLPDWVALALGCYVVIAVLNAIVWLITEVPDESTSGAREDEAP